MTAPDANWLIPRHLAVIMDGNGRWATARGEHRSAGHRAGGRALRALVQRAGELGVPVLTVYAFSQENWQRPRPEVDTLMRLFARALEEEVSELHANGIQLRFIGDREPFGPRLVGAMTSAEALTAANTRMRLQIALGYSGQWDLVQAAERCRQAGGPITAERLERALSTGDSPPVDLLIRTGGEFRISNFLLWQCAYAELYFSPILWPDFDAAALDAAIAWFTTRDRRFGGVKAA